MKITNKLVGLAAVVLVAAGLGVVTVTAQAGTDTTADAAAKVSVSAKASHKQAANTAAKTSAKQATPSSKQVAIKASAQSHAAASSSSAKPAVKQAAKASVASSQAVANNAKQAVATSQTQRTATAAAKPRVATPARVAVQTPAAKAAAKAASFRSSYGETYVGTISGLGHTTDVVQGSMSRTTAPAQSGLAMTWGGATRLSTTDGLTTEIAGHATSGTFSWIMGLGVGSQVSVTDASGHSRTYTVYATDNVNDQSYSTKTGKDQYNAITSAGQGEAVVLQTCISSSVNRIVWAH